MCIKSLCSNINQRPEIIVLWRIWFWFLDIIKWGLWDIIQWGIRNHYRSEQERGWEKICVAERWVCEKGDNRRVWVAGSVREGTSLVVTGLVLVWMRVGVSGMQGQDGGREPRGKLPLEGGGEEGGGWGRGRKRRKKENSDVTFALPFEPICSWRTKSTEYDFKFVQVMQFFARCHFIWSCEKEYFISKNRHKVKWQVGAHVSPKSSCRSNGWTMYGELILRLFVNNCFWALFILLCDGFLSLKKTNKNKNKIQTNPTVVMPKFQEIFVE